MTLPPLMAIVDADAAARAGWTMVDLAAAYLDGGARLIQIRAKRMSSADLLEVACAVVTRARSAQATVIVNDRADIARLAGADGVHVGQDDLAPADVRTILGADASVGRSTHTPEQVESALREPISYVAIGPVFDTATKATGYEALGLGPVRHVARLTRERGVPLVAIGGVTLDTALDVLRAGAQSVVVVGDLVRTGDPAARVRAYQKHLTV